MTNRIGFCCKWLDHPDQVAGLKPKDSAKQYTDKGTTVAWLNRQSRDVAEQKLWDIMVYNIEAVQKLIKKVGEQDAGLRMVRLSSNLLPVYTEPTYSYFWLKKDVRDYCEKAFAVVGATAKALDVRISFHPGQFCCVASNNPDVVVRSLEELEYHMDCARWMGYGQKFQDFKINIHLSGKLGAAGFLDAYSKMSPELRNCLTLENDEYQAGLNDLLPLSDKVAIVLDIHHHLINTGEYISAADDRIKTILDSWRGVRPVIHYSQSKSEYLTEETITDFKDLINQHNKTKLRAHSDFLPHKATNEWALTHLEWADCQVEAKGKNLAADQLYNQRKQHI